MLELLNSVFNLIIELGFQHGNCGLGAPLPGFKKKKNLNFIFEKYVIK